jgi:hypothetical protein
MNLHRKLILALLAIGILCVGVGIYSLIPPTQQEPIIQSAQARSQPNSEPVKPKPILKSISIPFTSFTYAIWDEYRGFDGRDFDNALYIWMRATGYIVYELHLPDLQGDQVTLTVQLSSELNKRTSNDQDYSSDVTLVINGKAQGMKNVIPDNLIGEEYTWSFPSNAFRVGKNDIRLQVGQYQHKNGLCIYSPIKIEFR